MHTENPKHTRRKGHPVEGPVTHESGSPPSDTRIIPRGQPKQQQRKQRRSRKDKVEEKERFNGTLVDVKSRHGYPDIPNGAVAQDGHMVMCGPDSIQVINPPRGVVKLPGLASSYNIRNYTDMSKEERYLFDLSQEQAKRDTALAMRKMEAVGLNVGRPDVVIVDHGGTINFHKKGNNRNLHDVPAIS